MMKMIKYAINGNEQERVRKNNRARQEMDIVINYPYLIAYAVDLHKDNV